MPTDSSTHSSSSEDEHRRRKTTKKHKSKTERKEKKKKKEKRHKSKKNRSIRDSSKEVVMPIASLGSNSEIATKAVEDLDASFGPALPPHLLQKAPPEKSLIGPVLPTVASQPITEKVDEKEDEEDCAVDTYGPMPVTATTSLMSATQIELEQRALELKLAAIEGGSMQNVDQKVREEWMLELPSVGLKGGLAALANLKRTFHQGKERPDFSDRSSWTKTPQDDAQKPSSSKATAETMQQTAQAIYERQRDAEQEHIAKQHKKKHKRDESLVELHQKKLRKEQRKREKELAAAGITKPERRPFSRDVDLKLNKIDKNQTKQIVDKAKILNSKFSIGQTKYL